MKRCILSFIFFVFIQNECYSIGIAGPKEGAIIHNSLDIGFNLLNLSNINIYGKDYFVSKSIQPISLNSYSFNLLTGIYSCYDINKVEEIEKVTFKNYIILGINFSNSKINQDIYYDSINVLRNIEKIKSPSNLKLDGDIYKLGFKMGKSFFINNYFEFKSSINYNAQWGHLRQRLTLPNTDLTYKYDTNFVFTQDKKEIILSNQNLKKGILDLEFSLKYHYYFYTHNDEDIKHAISESLKDGDDGYKYARLIAIYKLLHSISLEGGLLYQLNQIDEIKPFSFGIKLGYNF